MVNSGYTIGFEANSIIDSLIIIVNVAYFVSTLMLIQPVIDRWSCAHATSVRLDEILKILKLNSPVVYTMAKFNFDVKI